MTKLKTFTKREIVQEVIDELQELVDCVEPKFSDEGLCDRFDDIFLEIFWYTATYYFLEHCFKTWGRFSGCLAYPVLDPEVLSPRIAFRYTANKWAYDEYGMSRRDLTEHVIEVLEEIKRLY